MGARGKLKLADPLVSVAGGTRGTAAAAVPALAPSKPAAVANDAVLSAAWDEIVPALDAAGLLCPADAPAVELALRHFTAARVASDQLIAQGPTEYDNKNDRTMKNPAEVVFRSESELFLKYAAQLGMTFVSRARTALTEDGGADGNPFANIG